MVLQPTNLAPDTNSQPARPKRIFPHTPGGAQSRKFASVVAEIELPVGTPVAYNATLQAFVAWDPNTTLPADVNEVQEITFDAGVDGGTFRLGFKGEYTAAIAFGANAATIETAFEGLSSVGSGNGTVSGGTLPGTPVLITFTGTLAGAPQELVELDDNALTDGGLLIVGGVITRTVLGVTAGSVDEVQTLTIAGTPTGGTFTLTFDGQTTAPIDFDASAAEVELAFEALSNVGAGNGTCSGGALPGSTVVITFTGTMDDADVPLVYADASGLTGGTNVTAVVSQTTQGDSAEGSAAPAGTIVGFVHPYPITMLEEGQSFGVIMMRGEIHRDDVELPVTGTPNQAQLDQALRTAELWKRGLIVSGLSGVGVGT